MSTAASALRPRALARPGLGIALAFVLAALALAGSGAPAALRSDEGLVLGAALSLVRDGDLALERRDLRRVFAEAPATGPLRIRAIPGDDGRKGRWAPESLLAPAVLAWPLERLGRAGAFGVNALALVAAAALAGSWLRRRTGSPLAAPLAAGFFVFGSCLPLVFRAQATCLLTFLVALAVFTPLRTRLARFLAGSGLGLAAMAMPWLAFLGVARAGELLALRRRAGWWAAGLALGMLALLAPGLVAPADDGEAVWLLVENPRVAGGDGPLDWKVLTAEHALGPEAGSLPGPTGLLFGPHAGWLPYQPLVALAVLLWILPSRLSGPRPTAPALALLLAAGALLAFGGLWPPPPGAWDHLGDPRFAPLAPAFLLLVRAIPGSWVLPLGWTGGALLLGPTLLTALGSPVPELAVHGHLGNPPWDRLPVEQALFPRLDHWSSLRIPEGRLWYDEARFSVSGESLAPRDRRRGEIWFEAPRIPDNLVVLAEGPLQATTDLQVGERSLPLAPGAEARRLDVQRLRADREVGGSEWLRLLVPGTDVDPANRFRVGVLGSWEFLSRSIYDLEWAGCGAPPELRPGEETLVMARLRNLSLYPWTIEGIARVRLSYRWLTEAGEPVAGPPAIRTDLESPVAPGADLASWVRVVAPAEPGNYLLEVDPLFESVAWFSERNGGITCRVAMRIREG